MIDSPAIRCVYSDVWPIAKFVSHPKNPNQHPDSQLVLLGKIISKHGWRRPIVVSGRSGFVIKGHGRLEAARIAGWDTAPVEIQNYASEREEIADMVADNRLQEMSELDDLSLKQLLKEISDEGISLDLAGFDERAYNLLMAETAAQTVQTATSDRASNRKLGARIIQYNVIFETADQQQQWFSFLKFLKGKFPEKETIADRIIACIETA